LRPEARTGFQSVRVHRVASNRRCPNLQGLLSDGLEHIRELVVNGVADGAGNANASRFGQQRNARGKLPAPLTDLGTRFDQSCESFRWQRSDGTDHQIVAMTGHLTISDPDAESDPPVG
jgi:hypothetical protein